MIFQAFHGFRSASIRPGAQRAQLVRDQLVALISCSHNLLDDGTSSRGLPIMAAYAVVVFIAGGSIGLARNVDIAEVFGLTGARA